ncbi:MAG TPA: metallophosphoesterase [Pyrinomonadaceae bacterium]|nr:metallophosphoesterase [Pyrinomonadaceae bacterium]HMP64992.1 metallophosphoesterase [Pyrinomonadaceae bacterium]
MRKWIKRIGLIFGAFGLLIAVFLSYAYFIEPRRFVVIEETIEVPNWDPRLNGLRVLTIADMHTGSNYAPPERIQYVVEQANAQQPDIIVLLGDYVSESKWDREALKGPEGTDRTELKVPVETIASILGGLRAKYGVFAIIGNHDWYHNEEKIARQFREAGLDVLQNEIREIAVNDATLRIWGIEDLWRNRIVPVEPYNALDEKRNIIAITHNPDSLFHAPDEVSIMFAGHTHGGQLNWPIVGPLAVFNDPLFMDGLAEVEGKYVYVSSGVGTSVLPLRFRVPPEINVITLVSK